MAFKGGEPKLDEVVKLLVDIVNEANTADDDVYVLIGKAGRYLRERGVECKRNEFIEQFLQQVKDHEHRPNS